MYETPLPGRVRMQAGYLPRTTNLVLDTGLKADNLDIYTDCQSEA